MTGKVARVGAPAGWVQLPLREGAHIKAGGTPNYVGKSPTSVPIVGSNGTIGWTDRPNCASGIAVGRVGASGSVHYIDRPLWLSDNVLHVEPRLEVWESRFLFHMLQQANLPRLATKTAQPLITQTELGSLLLFLPPLPEQRAIAAVLDSIDEAIERTEEVIAATEELRQALLQDLLTNGVPGWHTEWKHVPGIGTVPADWNVVRLGEVAEVTSGFAIGPDRTPMVNYKPYLTVANVQADQVTVTDMRYMEVTDSEYASRHLVQDDLVMVEGHARISELGRAALVPREFDGFTFQNHLFRIRGKEPICLNAFICAYVNGPSGRSYFKAFGGTTSGLNTVSATNVKRLRMPLPPKAEQEMVVRSISAPALRLEHERETLRSLRTMKTTLASALLSGGIRVT